MVEQTDFQNLAQYLKKLVFYIWIDTCEKSHKTIGNSVKNLSLFFCTMTLHDEKENGIKIYCWGSIQWKYIFHSFQPTPSPHSPPPLPHLFDITIYISHFTRPSLTSYLSRKNHQKISCMTATEASDWKSFLQNLLKPDWLGSKEKKKNIGWKSHSKHEHFLTILTKLQKSVIFFCIYKVILESLTRLFWWMILTFLALHW